MSARAGGECKGAGRGKKIEWVPKHPKKSTGTVDESKPTTPKPLRRAKQSRSTGSYVAADSTTLSSTQVMHQKREYPRKCKCMRSGGKRGRRQDRYQNAERPLSSEVLTTAKESVVTTSLVHHGQRALPFQRSLFFIFVIWSGVEIDRNELQ